MAPFGSAAQSRHRYGGSMAGRNSVLGDFTVLLEAVEGLEEEQPGELRDAVEVAVEAGVLPHGVASRLDDGSQLCLR